MGNPMPDLVPGLVALAGVYLALGVVVGIPLVVRGVNHLDPAARAGTAGFRLLILPGTVLFWPAMLVKWINARSGRAQRPTPPDDGATP